MIQYILGPLLSYRDALRSGQLSFWLICAIALYTPFEDFIAAWLPIPSSLRTLIRFIPEVIIYSIFLQVCLRKIFTGKGLRKTPIDIPVVAIFVSAFFSIIVNGASLPGSIANLRTNWRYLALYYILVNLEFSYLQVRNLLKNLQKVFILQGVIASIQFFLPSSFNVAFSGGNCNKAGYKGASCGTFLDTANLSGFLIIAVIIVLTLTYTGYESLIPGLKDVAATVIVYFGLFASKKRAALLVSLIIPFIILFYLRRRKNLAIILWVVAIIASAAFFVTSAMEVANIPTPNSNSYSNQLDSAAEEGEPADIATYFGSIFTEEYWEHTLQSSRGWAIVVTFKALSKSGNWWFGFGPELGIVRKGIEVYLNPDDQEQLQRNLYVFDDPYWFAIIAYFGLVGLFLYWLVLWQLNQASGKVLRGASSEEEKAVGVIMQSLTIVAFLYSFVERLFRIREFSLYFWLFAGLAINFYCLQREKHLLQREELPWEKRDS